MSDKQKDNGGVYDENVGKEENIPFQDLTEDAIRQIQ